MTSSRLFAILAIAILIVSMPSAAFPDIGAAGNERLSADDVLAMLDHELEHRDLQIEQRQLYIDSLRHCIFHSPDDFKLLEELGHAYASFNNDSAIAVYSRAYSRALAAGLDTLADRFKLLRAPHMPLGGFIAEAINDYHSIDTTRIPARMMPLYFDAGRQMYSHIGAFYVTFPDARNTYERLATEAQLNLLPHLEPHSVKYMLNAGEALYKQGEYSLAASILTALTDSIPSSDNAYARATHILSDIAQLQDNDDDHLYYLAMSALADIRSATLEVTSLQELGALMHHQGDVERAFRYLSVALQNAVMCHAETRMLQTAMDLPLIESVHRDQLNASRSRMKAIIAVLVVAMVALVVALVMYHRQSVRSRRLRDHLEQTNRIKEIYISQFLKLCSSYVDRINKLCSIVSRKIAAGKADELMQLTQSGKFVENQSKEFYAVFDSAFLHIYPDFVENVNALLQPDRRIVQRDPDALNTDLRILAFMRMGIDDSGRIAELLNYSVNTIYTYRNKLKNCAINRDTFEADIRSL